MTQHQTFLRFLSDVLARAEEPAEPAEPHCLSMTSQLQTKTLPVGTCGTGNSADGNGSARHTGRSHPCGTENFLVPQRLEPHGSAVPQFRDQAGPREPDGGSCATDERERSAIAHVDGQIPAIYAAGFARLQVTRPLGTSDWQWQQTINDAGLFLDRWGRRAEQLGWTSDDLFAPPAEAQHRGGLVWRLEGRRVAAMLVKGALVYCSLRQAAEEVPVRKEQGKTIVWLRGEMAGRHPRRSARNHFSRQARPPSFQRHSLHRFCRTSTHQAARRCEKELIRLSRVTRDRV